MARNIDLLTQVRDLITAQPEKLDMDRWAVVQPDEVEFTDGTTAKVSCGTTACIAGWAVQLSGHKLLVHQYGKHSDGSFLINSSVAKNGRVVDIEQYGKKLLGLTTEEADELFFCGNSQAPKLLDTLIAGGDIVPEDTDDDDEY